MEKSFNQSMRILHTYSGLIVAWLLFAIFVTGTSSYYREEINLWMKPELHNSKPSKGTMNIALDKAVELSKNTDSLYLTLPNSRSNTITIMRVVESTDNPRGEKIIYNYDASTGELLQPRKTAGGDFLYNFHFELYNLPVNVARWIVGIATMFMFVAIITGIIIHKRIFKDIFTFRPKNNIRGWMDLHILPAVATLPFMIMITYSGLLLFMNLLMPWGMEKVYKGNEQAYWDDIMKLQTSKVEMQEFKPNIDILNNNILKENLEKIIINANEYFPNNIGGFSIIKDKNNIVIEVEPKISTTIFYLRMEREYLHFDAKTTQLILKNTPPTNSYIMNTYATLETLHRAKFADSTLRFIFFISGLSGVIIIGSGLILWIQKRQKRDYDKKSFGFWLVEKLNLGTIIGILLSIGTYFLANRDIWEINIFFLVWLLSFIHAFLREIKQAWIEQLIITSIIYFSIPIISAFILLTDFNSFLNRNSFLHYFDLYFILNATIFAICAFILIKNRNKGE